MTNCIFNNNSATDGGAIYYDDYVGGSDDKGDVSADSCIFKTESDTLYDVSIYAPTLSVDNFESYFNSGEKVTFYLKSNSGMAIYNGNISISVYYNDNNSFFANYSCLSGERWTVYLPAGSYYAVYNTEYAEFKSVNRTVSISKANSTIEIVDVVLYYGNSINVTVKTVGATGITAKIDGNDVSVINNFTIPISGLDAGNYTLTLTSIPDENHNSINKTATITVNKAVPEIILTNETVNLLIGDVIPAGASLSPADAGELVYTSSDSGIVQVEGGNITAVSSGIATVTVSFAGSKNYAAVNKTITVNVVIPTELSANSITATYNINKDLVITLKDYNGTPLSGVNISVSLNGVKTYTTNSNGQVKVVIKGLAAKKYAVKITFSGNTKYGSSTKDVTVTVKKATPKITAKKKTFKVKTKTKKYKIILKNNLKKAMSKVKVTLKVKGKTYSAKTNSKGKATFKITKLKKKGTFKAKVTYKGNANYNKVTKKVKIKVK